MPMVKSFGKKFICTGSIYITNGNAIAISDNFYTFGGIFGGQLTIGDSTLLSDGGLDIFLLQCDTAGNINWIKKAGSTGRETIYDLIADEKGNTYLTGGYSNGFKLNESSYSSKGNTDVYIGAIDSLGNTLWMLTGGSNIAGHQDDLLYDENGASIAIDSKNQIQIVGTTIGSGNFGDLKYIASEDVKTNAFWLTLGSKSSNYTDQYLCDNTSVLKPPFSIKLHPNPFTDNLIISNSENTDANYLITLYNNLGQKIDSQYHPNSSTITITSWNSISTGIYLLKIDTGTISKTFKIVKI